MASYSIEVSATAEKQLRRLPKAAQKRVLRAIVGLGTVPLRAGSRKLTGYDDVLRIRVGTYRLFTASTGAVSSSSS